MELKLTFPIPPLSSLINIRDSNILLMGSCFAEHIGAYLKTNKFRVLSNPNGILFHPLGIADALLSYVAGKTYHPGGLFHDGGLYHSWKHHGVFSGPSESAVLDTINRSQKEASAALKNCDQIILTFGSAFLYELRETGEPVVNCHKMPAADFEKRLVNASEIVAAFDGLFAQEALSKKKVILTVSPVRYVRDGLVENNRSKASLLTAVHELCSKHKNLSYFPAYEIVTDELRDYRFFEKDLVHPNALAIEYVWERFRETAMDEETKTILKELATVVAARHHRALHPETQEHRNFLQVHLQKTKTMKEKYPFLDLSEEVRYFGGTGESQ